MQELTIHQLRKQGYKVRVHHQRETLDVLTLTGINKFLSARGGSTTIELTTPDGKTAIGESRCSLQDNFCRRTGSKLALERAFQKLEI